tara:strand:- start:37748 stop:38920 length:1173 start_codon:yes stop_codon:yes gene_type:complete
MTEICLKGSTLTQTGQKIRVNAVVEGCEPIWFELDKQFQSMIDFESVDAFFILYVWLAMERGLGLRVEGKVSRQLADAVTQDIQKMFLALCPRLHDIDIDVLNPESAWPQSAEVPATGFSGGVDSWYTALQAAENGTPYSYYLFANTGQHGKDNVEEVFAQRFAIAESALRTMDKPLIAVDSNIDRIFRERFQQRDVIGNIACALLLQQGISRYDYSSTYAPEGSGIFEHYDMSIMDPYLLPLLNTERIHFFSIGDDAGRIDKLEFISSRDLFSNEIYVCIEKAVPIKNCGYCFKCRRTQLALESIDRMALLKNNFDFSLYKKIRLGSMVGLFSSVDKSNLDLEIKSALIKKYGLNIFFVRVFSVLWSLTKKLMPEGVRWRTEQKFPYLW